MLKQILFKTTKADKFLFLLLLIVSLLLLYYMNFKSNKKVDIFVNNLLSGSYNLNEDQLIYITADRVAEIKDGYIRMITCDCPGQICVKQGWTKSSPIVCVPNKILISVRNDSGKEKNKFITY